LAKRKLPETLDEANGARERANALIAAVKPPSSEPISPEWLAQRQAALKALKAVSAAGFGTRAARAPGRAYFVANRRAEQLAAAYGLVHCGGFAVSCRCVQTPP